MGGGDKALRDLGGKPVIRRVLERLSGQAAPIALNANGDPARFLALGLPIIPDATGDFPGPLAGVLAGMRWAAAAAPNARFIATAACDTPFFPRNLVETLLSASVRACPAIVLAASGEQVHPVFGLWPVALADDLAAAVQNGTRKVAQWAERHSHFTARFPFVDAGGKLVDPFFNANTPEDLAEAESLLALECAP